MFVLEITLPDGKNWCQGISLVGTGDSAIAMNIWTTNWNELGIGRGLFTFDEAGILFKAIGTEGCTIRPYSEVMKEFLLL